METPNGDSRNLPTGTVTFPFTDIEDSTRLLHDLADRCADLLADHHRLLRACVGKHGGKEVGSQGEGMFFAFDRAKDAVSAAVAIQRALATHAWPLGTSVRIRMGLHTGEPLRAETGYVGIDVHRAARVCAAGHGGQALLSQSTRELVERDLPDGVTPRDLGAHGLKDLARPEHLSQLVIPELPADFPPLRSLDTLPNNLPRQLTRFIGRERELAELKRLFAGTSLLTLTGVGGCGKTRLALQAAADELETFRDGVWLVELAALTDPNLLRATGNRWVLILVLEILSLTARAAHDYDRAEALSEECVRLARELGHKTFTSACLASFAEIAAARGEVDRVARLLGAAERLAENLGGRGIHSDRSQVLRSAAAAARTALGEAAFAAARAEGRGMTPERAVEYALERP